MKNWKHKLRMRVPAVGLLITTLLFWGAYDRYRPDGPVLLESPPLADAVRVKGDSTESEGRYTLRVRPGDPPARANFPLPNGTDFDRIQVRGRIKVDGVVKGRHPWSCARLLLVQYDKNNKWISGHHGVVSEAGTQDWIECEDVFEIDDTAARVDLVIQQLGREGVAAFDRLSARPVQLRWSYNGWRMGFAAGWLILGVVYYRRCRLERRRLRRLILFNAIVIVMGTLMPGKWIQESAQYAGEEAVKLVEAVRHSEAPAGASQQPAVPKADEYRPAEPFEGLPGGLHGTGHFVLFASLCFLVYLSAALEGQHRSYFLRVAFDILLFAAVTESLQYLTSDRSPGIKDWLIDLAGMLSALLLFAVVMLVRPVGKGPVEEAIH